MRFFFSTLGTTIELALSDANFNLLPWSGNFKQIEVAQPLCGFCRTKVDAQPATRSGSG